MMKRGDQGEQILAWQRFLNSKGWDAGPPDGIFGARTETATKAFQSANALGADGIAGSATLAAAIKKGFDYKIPYWPALPDFPAIGDERRRNLFGGFDWRPAGRSEIRIAGDWVEKNIISVPIPQIDPGKVEGFPSSGAIRFHRKAAPQLQGFFKAVSDAGLIHRIISYAGSFYPRRIRGGSRLSNHSWGTAFDINAAWNWLGQEPAREGQKGYLRDLVPIAHQFGFYWGGHFGRKDGMHFEAAVFLQKDMGGDAS